MGILLVYDVTDEASFNNIRNWMRNIEQHASDNVNKVGEWSTRFAASAMPRAVHKAAMATLQEAASAAASFCGRLGFSRVLHRLRPGGHCALWVSAVAQQPQLPRPPLLLLQILVGNKSDMADEKRAVPYAKGQALADEYGIKFFETSAKENLNVEEVSRQHLAQQCMHASCAGPQSVKHHRLCMLGMVGRDNRS
jgi:hypothetical protein